MAERTGCNGHVGLDRQQGGVTSSDCGATAVVAKTKQCSYVRGSDCGDGASVKRRWWKGAREELMP